jgi:WD40 repeat protein
VTASEYDSNCPLVICPSNDECQSPKYLSAFEKLNIDYIAMLDNDQYYVVITGDLIVYMYSVNDLAQTLFQYTLTKKSQIELFSLRTYHSNIIIFMFYNQFIFLQIKVDRTENLFQIQSEQILSIPNREVEYSLEFTPNKQFLILKQSLNLEKNPYLNDLRIFICDNHLKISPITEPITYIKSKLATSGKIIGFTTYVALNTRSELWIAHQGLILHVRLPSYIAELDMRSDYHCWMRHSLALYGKTTEKYSLSITITSLVVRSSDDSCLVSGADDGSIVIWHLTDKCSHDVLESIHLDEVENHISIYSKKISL